MVKIIKKNNKIYKQIAKDKEIQAGLSSLKELFKEMYDRDIEKYNEPAYLFWNVFNDKKPYNIRIINMMRKCEIGEDIIYVYYKTGRILTEINEKFLTEDDKNELDFYYEEYKNLMNKKIKDNKINIVQFIKFGNKFLFEKYSKIDNYINSTLNDFLRRHLEKKKDFLDYEIKTELDFLGFCCIKTYKDLESIKSLIEMQMTENIYSVCRSIFETYINLVNLVNDENYFENNILMNMKNATYDFNKSKNGKINYSQLLVRKGKTKNISIHNLCEKSPYLNDKNLYDVFYRSACQFVHLDVMSAKSYFHESDPFFEIDSSIVASIIGLTCATLLIEQFSKIKYVKPIYRNDITILTKKLKKELLLCFEVIQGEPTNQNDIFNCFIERLK